ncbi:uncharacterized protein YJR142W isoform X1 [Lingula anatina]|uniref:Uncharacterized protein YJR142W isoform X1 n=1 Tax=Lingula anatina TaxID=7574 RepID=A0A1S3HD91_LINAN|nr:uncharacterized protein YJR142W isoform X1 [Lingula anatina]|eukprot:XP_013384003.1 uncharacterized protein YJR142W isoform X1 [Lingula anatina]
MNTKNLSEGFMRVVSKCNSFLDQGSPWRTAVSSSDLHPEFTGVFRLTEASSRKECRPFFIENKQVGLIRPDILAHLKPYTDVFHIPYSQGNDNIKVHLNPSLQTFEERSEAVEKVLLDLREKDVFKTLRGWRDEYFNIWYKFSEPPLMKMERAATCLFGVKQYGVHINGWTRHPTKGVCMWIARRSKTKPTWPNMLDNLAAGGLSSKHNIMECARSECQEEASVPNNLLDNLKPVGTVSYFYEDERGLFPECEYIMDLEVPEDFVPENADGEVAEFYLWTIQEVLEKTITSEFKSNSALIAINFCIRHGLISPDDEPNYQQILEGMHAKLT